MSQAHHRTPRLLCLTGFMGCGKTTVGQLLARQIAWHFVDLDTRIEQHAGLSIPAIFEQLGERVFREMEAELLAHALGQARDLEQPTVVALGGGTIAQPGNLDLVRSYRGVLVWLECAVEELLARCALVTNRPLFRDAAGFRQLYQQRLPFYEQADYRVDAAAEPRRVVEQILALGLLDREPRSNRGERTPTREGVKR